jgi:hypothetical protein
MVRTFAHDQQQHQLQKQKRRLFHPVLALIMLVFNI